MNLYIPAELWQQMQYYADICTPNEVTGIGTIRASPDKTELFVTEIFLPAQHTNATYSQFDDGALNEVIYDLICKDPQRAPELRFRWHSHAESSTFWSATDLSDIESWESDWVVNLVLNARGDFLARLDIFEPLRIRNIELNVCFTYPDNPELYARCREEVQGKVQRSFLPRLGGKKP